MESIIPEKNYSEINIFIDSLIVYLCKVSKVDYASNEIRCKERFLLSCNVFFSENLIFKKDYFFYCRRSKPFCFGTGKEK